MKIKLFKIIVLLILSCSPLSNLDVEPPQDRNSEIAQHLKNAEEFQVNLDFKKALEEVEKAEQLIESKSLEDTQYLSLLLLKSRVYSYFERLDEAEATLLRTTGISEDKIKALSDSKTPLSRTEIEEIGNEVLANTLENDEPGYHIALSFIYNILGEESKLKEEQQKTMDLSSDKEMPVAIGLELYKIRGRKIDVHRAIEQQQEFIQKEGRNDDNEYYLAEAYYLAGWFQEAEEIVDKYLQVLPKDSDSYLSFLFLKMNIEMGLGHYEEMKDYEKQILQIDPNAFEYE